MCQLGLENHYIVNTLDNSCFNDYFMWVVVDSWELSPVWLLPLSSNACIFCDGSRAGEQQAILSLTKYWSL